MHKTIYIDVDEEITSILDRVRSEEATSIVLVVPKSAMLTQGVINLKLLKKEIDEMGKALSIATNDKHARRVIERLEIKTQEAKGDVLSESSEPEKKESVISKKAAGEAVEILSEEPLKQDNLVDSVGSSDFFDQGADGGLGEKPASEKEAGESLSSELEKKKGKKTINLQQSQDLKGSLYANKDEKSESSVEESEEEPLGEIPVAAPKKAPSLDVKAKIQPFSMDVAPRQKKVDVKNENPVQKDLFGESVEEEQSLTTNKGGFGSNEAAEKAEKFFSKDDEASDKPISLEEPKKKKKKSGKVWGVLIFLLVFGGILAGVFAWGYTNYPKVSVMVFPKKETLSKEIKIIAKEGASVSDISLDSIPGEYVELSISKSMDFNSTGETYESDDGKAKGKVLIKNEYSSSEQPLVKTTRLLSKEGKLFRIVGDVEVPGMNGEEPGEVEVEVIADEPGEDFNINPSTFTIEGFKGNPKYEKFKVSSSKSMSDGGSPDSNKKMSMVTKGDIDKARKETIEALDTVLEQEVSSKLGDGKKVLIDSVEKEVEGSKSSYDEGDVAKTFTFTVSQKVKAIAFSVEDVNFVVMQELEKEMSEGFAMDSVTQVTFKKGIANHEDKNLTMYVNAQAEAWPVISTNEVTAGVAGKNENEIRSFLSGYPNIEKVEITIVPSWLTTIPVSEDKITVEEKR